MKEKTIENFIEESKGIHGNEYDYSKVKYKNAHSKVCIICPKHGEFWQRPYSHLNGCGCPMCKAEKTSKRQTLSNEEFIEKARRVHGNKYDYSKVEYVHGRIKICIICPEHGEFWQRPNDHLDGHGCQKCARVMRTNKRRLTTEQFITKAKEVHGDKYDYSKVEYINNHSKVCIICPKHGEFWQEPVNHLNGAKCHKCAHESAKLKLKKTNEQFIREASEIHNHKYDYSKTNYINNETKVCIICPEHGEFWQIPSAHLRGQGCPTCNNSKIEKDVYNILTSFEIPNERYTNINGILGEQTVDFYLPNEKIAIECQGLQHFIDVPFFNSTLEDNLKRDIRKKDICQENGIKIKYYIKKIIGERFNIINNDLYKGIYNQNNIIYV